MLKESLDDPVESGVSFEFSLIQKAGMMVPYPSSSKNPRFSGPTAGSFSCAKLNYRKPIKINQLLPLIRPA